MATEKVTYSLHIDDLKQLKNEMEDMFEVLREQEEKLESLYELEAAVSVLATAVASRVHDIAETNEALYTKMRNINVIINRK